jgi:hypothetical protein
LSRGDNFDEITGRVAYESGAVFSKAFKREKGIAPWLYRRILLRARAGNLFGLEHSALGPGLNTRPVTISPVPSFLGRRFESYFYRRF